MEKLRNVLVYEWNSWRGYLISHLVEPRRTAAWDDPWQLLDQASGPGIEAVLFHNCLSHSALFPRRRGEFERSLAQKGIRILNGGLADMRKSTLHAMLERAGLRCARASRHGPRDQRLFVKTDLNYGGKAERALPEELRPLFSAAGECPILDWNDYRVMRRDEIDPAWWDDPHLAIETFIAHDDTLYRVYGCGDSLICVLAHSDALIKKDHDHPDNRAVFADRRHLRDAGELPADLRRQLAGFTARYPFDFYCLDVVHDGTDHTIIDLNLTPFYGEEASDPDWLAFLLDGLDNRVKAPR